MDRDDYWGDSEPRRNRRPRTRGPNWIGIASLLCSILSMFGSFITVAAITLMQVNDPDRFADEKGPETILVGLVIMGFALVGIIALGLGIAGVNQTRSSKVSAILGIVFSTATLLGVCGLVLLGLASQ